jgi:hypothetical protein
MSAKVPQLSYQRGLIRYPMLLLDFILHIFGPRRHNGHDEIISDLSFVVFVVSLWLLITSRKINWAIN